MLRKDFFFSTPFYLLSGDAHPKGRTKKLLWVREKHWSHSRCFSFCKNLRRDLSDDEGIFSLNMRAIHHIPEFFKRKIRPFHAENIVKKANTSSNMAIAGKRT